MILPDAGVVGVTGSVTGMVVGASVTGRPSVVSMVTDGVVISMASANTAKYA